MFVIFPAFILTMAQHYDKSIIITESPYRYDNRIYVMVNNMIDLGINDGLINSYFANLVTLYYNEDMI